MGILSASGGPVMPGPVRAYTKFEQQPLCVKSAGAGAATGTAGDVNLLLEPGYGNMDAVGFEYTIIGTQTILSPVLAAGGLDIGMDQTNNDGVSFTHGITARNPFAFVVGTDGACFAKATFTVADVTGADPLYIGFRKVEAHQADYNDYDEFVGIGILSDGSFQIETILNAAATVTTDTTQNAADGTEFSLGVFVSAAGVVTFQINGAAPTVTKAFTFDTGEVVMPYVLFMHGSDVAGTVLWSEWDCGAQ